MENNWLTEESSGSNSDWQGEIKVVSTVHWKRLLEWFSHILLERKFLSNCLTPVCG